MYIQVHEFTRYSSVRMIGVHGSLIVKPVTSNLLFRNLIRHEFKISQRSRFFTSINMEEVLENPSLISWLYLLLQFTFCYTKNIFCLYYTIVFHTIVQDRVKDKEKR